jgi:hypothetical protein
MPSWNETATALHRRTHIRCFPRHAGIYNGAGQAFPSNVVTDLARHAGFGLAGSPVDDVPGEDRARESSA